MKFNKEILWAKSGYPPEWYYLNSPSSCTKEQAYRLGSERDYITFEKWAMAYADGKFYNKLAEEYKKGLKNALSGNE